MVLQPSEERRRSGSHYTPRALTEPIVRKTLEPILARLRGEDGRPPRPAQVLDLKICDPAMGSGAFLVEACRAVGECRPSRSSRIPVGLSGGRTLIACRDLAELAELAELARHPSSLGFRPC